MRLPWPITLTAATPAGEAIVLRTLTRKDEREFLAVRRANRDWLAPWEATSPVGEGRRTRFAAMVRQQRREAQEGRQLPLVIEADGRIVGQLNLFAITLGAMWGATAGYWMAESAAGRGIMPTALAAAADYLMTDFGLHRIEVNIRPENTASLAVVAKLGFRDEGVRERFLHIDGDWRDHRTFALVREDLRGGTIRDRLVDRRR